ncbi:MAG: response regulator [Alphaproteobacteria bacterium]|nr:response regulator [Alphaproteobacteria bacterium]
MTGRALTKPLAGLTRLPSAEGWLRLVDVRVASARERFAFATGAGAVAALVYQDAWALAWMGATLTAIVLERLMWQRLRPRIAAGQPAPAFALGAAVFALSAVSGSLALVLWRNHEAGGDVVAALFLSAILLSALVTMRAAPPLALASAVPAIAYVGLAPLAYGGPLDGPRFAAIVAGLVFLVAFTVSIWTRLAQADRAEREALEAARAASVEAQRAHAAKSAFLSGMGRELRTPISMVLGAAALLRRADMSPDDRATVDTMLDAGDVLVAVLNDIIDAARVETGDARVTLAPASPAQIAHGVVTTWRPRADDKWLELFLDVEESAHAGVMIDAARVKQILFCLVSNAVRYTDHGGVRVQVSATPSGEGRQVLIFRVSDTGPGLTEARAQAVLEGRAAMGADGSGLSLARSRRLARAMGGDIMAESVVGEGATFTLTLDVDLARDDASPAEPHQPSAEAALRVLIVDDHAVSRRFAAGLLSELGAHCTLAGDGAEALAALETTQFDLVLMDINMPDMSGYDVVRRLRQSTFAGADSPVIALTAAAGPDDRRRCYEAGMEGHVAKPVSPAELFAEIFRVLDAAGARRAA